jgi:hypothetical protein
MICLIERLKSRCFGQCSPDLLSRLRQYLHGWSTRLRLAFDCEQMSSKDRRSSRLHRSQFNWAHGTAAVVIKYPRLAKNREALKWNTSARNPTFAFRDKS